ncbi:hypothetical protein MA16_Dca022567 [Dendrobium catenatum]|uniref:Uncharacterized protein n=1 Tax=Dendrobium catenatum TaxID=906689 RepID=A0A2I0X2X6_9ASPA|nr:hypothetical protein MA16_Dca022567 [Dendrobium catenatum]
MSRSSLRATLDPHFLEAGDQAAYQQYKEARITVFQTFNPNFLSYSALANHFLHNSNAEFHMGETSTLLKDARIVQHVLHTLIIPKAGDHVHITPLLSLTTFFILANREFNATDLIFHYIDHLTTILDPGHRRKANLALGHFISYVLESKYNLHYHAPPNHQPAFYSNISFQTLHITHLHSGDGEAQAGEEKAPVPTPAPIPALVSLLQHSQLDQLVERFDQLEARFDTYIAAQE